jgi:hypothetical protein
MHSKWLIRRQYLVWGRIWRFAVAVGPIIDDIMRILEVGRSQWAVTQWVSRRRAELLAETSFVCSRLFELCKMASVHILIQGYHLFGRSRVSSVSIVSDYGLDDRAIGVRSPAGAKDCSSSLCVQTGSGAHPASCTMGTGGPFPGGKARSERDADHSPPSSAEIVNE